MTDGSMIALSVICYCMLYFAFNINDKHVSLKWFFMAAGLLTMLTTTAVIYQQEQHVPVNQDILDAIDIQTWVIITAFGLFCIYLVYGLILGVLDLFKTRAGDANK